MKPEYLMLAQRYDPNKHHIGGWYISTKLDGIRAFWDGGISRGMAVSDVPYANTVKDARFINQDIRATGLWSRTGKVINAPSFWLNELPKYPLDGELIGGDFQDTMRLVSGLHGNWDYVTYHIFDSPNMTWFLKNRKVKVRDYEFEIKDAYKWFLANNQFGDCWNFELTQLALRKRSVNWGSILKLVPQTLLPLNLAEDFMGGYMSDALNLGYEGVVLRKRESFWIPERSWNLLKLKPCRTAEGIVIGYFHAEPGKIAGKMGALVLRLEDTLSKTFKVSGFTDAEREYSTVEDYEESIRHPGVFASEAVVNPTFPLGTRVEFKYRELTKDGIPKEARYHRKRDRE